MNYIESLWITTKLLARDMIVYSNRKIGGIRFIKLGRISMSFCVTKGA